MLQNRESVCRGKSYLTEQGGSLQEKQLVALQNMESVCKAHSYVTEQGVCEANTLLCYRTGG